MTGLLTSVTFGILAVPVTGCAIVCGIAWAVVDGVRSERRANAARAETTSHLAWRAGCAAALEARDEARMFSQIASELLRVAELEAAFALDFDGADH